MLCCASCHNNSDREGNYSVSPSPWFFCAGGVFGNVYLLHAQVACWQNVSNCEQNQGWRYHNSPLRAESGSRKTVNSFFSTFWSSPCTRRLANIDKKTNKSEIYVCFLSWQNSHFFLSQILRSASKIMARMKTSIYSWKPLRQQLKGILKHVL